MINNEVEKIRLALLIEYNGKNLVGWQKQNNGKSVQGEIEQVAKILFKIDCPVQGAGRTDAGVNALGQVAHIDIPKLNSFSDKSNVYIITAFNSLLIKTEIRIILENLFWSSLFSINGNKKIPNITKIGSLKNNQIK